MVRAWTGSGFDRPGGRPEGLRVLVVEGGAGGATSLALALSLEGHQVECARGGRAALAAARARPPDVVLLDLDGPDAGRRDVARKLRDLADRKQPLVIALTGSGSEPGRETPEEADVDLELVKPISPPRLKQTLHTLRRFQAILG